MSDKSEVQSTSTMITFGMVLLLLSQVPIMVNKMEPSVTSHTFFDARPRPTHRSPAPRRRAIFRYSCV